MYLEPDFRALGHSYDIMKKKDIFTLQCNRCYTIYEIFNHEAYDCPTCSHKARIDDVVNL